MNSYIRGLQFATTHPFYKDSERASNMFDTDTYIKDDIVRWKSNDRIPPKELLEFWNHIGKKFNYVKSLNVLNEDTDKFLNNYRTQMENYKYSNEEVSEMRSAFGKGTTVVNVLTGKKIKL